MAKLPKITDLPANTSGWGFFLCTRKDLRSGRTGNDFLEVALQDVSGEIRAKVFQDVDALKHEFEAGEFVKVQGRSNLFQGRIELILERIRRVIPDQDAKDGFREEDCIQCAPRPVDEMWAELIGRIASIEDPALRALLTHIVDRHADRLRIWPFPIELSSIRFDPDLELSNLDGTARVTRIAQGLLVQAKLQPAQQTECVRCLTEFEQELHADFTELYAFTNKSVTDSGLLWPEDGHIDLAPLVREYMLLDIPDQTAVLHRL